MSHYISMNGELVPRDLARISVLDHSFLYGLGVFETLRAYRGKILFVDRHLDRLYRSAAVLSLPIPADRETVKGRLYDTLSKNSLSNAYIRITVSMGEGEPGLDPALCEKTAMVIYAKPFQPYPKEWYTEGVKAAVVSVIKPVAGIGTPIKSCNYLYNYLAKREAKTKGALEGIMLTADGNVAEGTVSNLFIVNRGVLITPPTGEGVLDGVTRETVLDVARGKGIKTQEQSFSRMTLLEADECFLTNTTFEVLPVTRVDERVIGSGTPGEVTSIIAGLYHERVIQ